MLEPIKNLRRRRILRSLKDQPREKRILNIDEVHRIGVICLLDDEQHWNILHHFARVMENGGKEVHIIALQPKDREINFVITHQRTYKCQASTDFNFWGIPNAECLESFFNREYDLLIDTIGEDNFFAQYVALSSNALLKVTYATPNEDPTDVYDLIIRGEGKMEMKDFFNNVIEYLSMIKK